MKPHRLFLITTLIVTFICFVSDLRSGDYTIDINVHDTYFIIAEFHIWLALTIFLSFLTLIYFTVYQFNRSVNNYFALTHYTLTIVPLALIFVCIRIEQQNIERYTPGTYDKINEHIPFEKIILYLFIAFIIGQILLVLNISISKKNAIN